MVATDLHYDLAINGYGNIPLGQEEKYLLGGHEADAVSELIVPSFDALCEIDGLPKHIAIGRSAFLLTAHSEHSYDYDVNNVVRSIQIPERHLRLTRAGSMLVRATSRVNTSVISFISPQNGEYEGQTFGGFHLRTEPGNPRPLTNEDIARAGSLYRFILEDSLS